ncbi:Serine/threonine-protein kinase ppk15 [Candida viswanathii]|uniref:Serine/threonine-protein kinase ppk15 n=1 Tax=Candida viswanathii TaxID=5486 RepID=A0A367YMQ7_9ASCO|nr:Serine/threonine-protein kinase ppk15 [Candida viswanathii]
MAYNNYNYNRHNSIGGNWHLPPPAYQQQHQQQQPQSQSQSHLPQQQSQHSPQLQQQQNPDLIPNATEQYLRQPQQMPGFRNPWFSQQQQQQQQQQASPTSSMLSSSLSQSPTKSHQIPLLQQQQQQPSLNKRLSFANQLPTTYEYDNSKNNNVPPYIHPPTRADNPFNQYFSNQEVSLGGNDRRMSAAIDGTYYNPFGGFSQQNNAYPSGPAGAAGHQYLNNPSLGTVPSANRRSSLAVLPNHYRQQQQPQPLAQQPIDPNSPAAAYYLPPARLGRSALIIQYQQYQQALQSQKLLKTYKPAPKARKIYNKLELTPKYHQQPKYRRCSVNSIHISPVNALSVYLTESYSICQPRKFQYSKSTNPKRVLTKPLEPKYNNGYDNEDSDYILYVNDVLGSEEGKKYMVLDLLGSGTFGQVVKCQNLTNQSVCAVKVIKSKPAYMNQSLTEVRLLEFLNTNSDGKSFIRLLDTFMHKEHLCLVFELLASNLYELIKQNQFQGLNMRLVKIISKQLLQGLHELKSFQMIHCDLKPENILLVTGDAPQIKVIDFGSACFSRSTVYSYIQSRFYRSPEVILGLLYTESIDMWSLGCIVGELFLGLPLFPGTSEYNMLYKIVDMIGPPPFHMLLHAKNALNFFKKIPGKTADDKPNYVLKSYEEYCQFLEQKKGKPAHEKENKNYFKHKALRDIIMNYRLPSKKMTNSMVEKEMQEREFLVDFLTKVLNWNPLERLTPQEALKHPWLST